MTVAVCLKCGKMKLGALTLCPGCGHLPKLPEDQAEHIITSDHYRSKEDLQAISERVQKGRPVHFDREQVAEFAATLQEFRTPAKPVRRFRRGALAILILALLAGAIYWVMR
jgi:hypothetical protein